MARNEKVEQLRHVALFAGCTEKELAQIGRAADEATVDAGRVVVEEGASGHEFYLIIDGKASVTRDGDHVADLGPGDYFGEMAVLDGAPRGASVTAETPMTLMVLGQREFGALLDSWPGVARKLLVQMARRLREAESTTLSH